MDPNKYFASQRKALAAEEAIKLDRLAREAALDKEEFEYGERERERRERLQDGITTSLPNGLQTPAPGSSSTSQVAQPSSSVSIPPSHHAVSHIHAVSPESTSRSVDYNGGNAGRRKRGRKLPRHVERANDVASDDEFEETTSVKRPKFNSEKWTKVHPSFPTVIQSSLTGQVKELRCTVQDCGANANPRNGEKFFGGIRGLHVHFQMKHSELSVSERDLAASNVHKTLNEKEIAAVKAGDTAAYVIEMVFNRDTRQKQQEMMTSSIVIQSDWRNATDIAAAGQEEQLQIQSDPAAEFAKIREEYFAKVRVGAATPEDDADFVRLRAKENSRKEALRVTV